MTERPSKIEKWFGYFESNRYMTLAVVTFLLFMFPVLLLYPEAQIYIFKSAKTGCTYLYLDKTANIISAYIVVSSLIYFIELIALFAFDRKWGMSFGLICLVLYCITWISVCFII